MDNCITISNPNEMTFDMRQACTKLDYWKVITYGNEHPLHKT